MRYVSAAASIAITVLAIACGGDEESTNGSGADGEAAPKELQVAATDFSFVPTKLTGNTAQPIEVTLTNTGEARHTFTIDEYNIDVEVAAGDKTTFTVLPSEPGEFNYYCRFHQSQGMLGAISTTGEGGGDVTEEPTSEPDENPYTY